MTTSPSEPKYLATETGDCIPVVDLEPFEHVMVDIETMSLSKHNALILSIGAVEFDPVPREAPRIGKKWVSVLDIPEQLHMLRRVDAGTQKFWADKSQDEARQHWIAYRGERDGVKCALNGLRTFCAGAGRVWANGTQFDLTNIECLNEALQGAELWHYQAPRDMRTFVRETPQRRIMEIGKAIDLTDAGKPHEPVYDCLVQIHQVWQHWQDS